jgi:hypothetical protein
LHGSSGKLYRALSPLLNLDEYMLPSPKLPYAQNFDRAFVAAEIILYDPFFQGKKISNKIFFEFDNLYMEF